MAPTTGDDDATTRPRLPAARRTWVVVGGARVRVRPSTAQLADEIREQLVATGEAWSLLGERDVSAECWRQAARSVAHDLGRPVVTDQDHAEVRARLKDWPRDWREARLDHHRHRAPPAPGAGGALHEASGTSGTVGT